MAFPFIDPGRLIDGELELIAPSDRWIDDYLAGIDPTQGRMSRGQLSEFLKAAPNGRYDGDVSSGRVPAYHFWMRLHPPSPTSFPKFKFPRWAVGRLVRRPPLAIAGAVGLRVGNNEDIRRNLGHIGYNVQPFARGNHYAERACRLLRPLALHHNLDPIWITCNPDNWASRRTCERLNAALVEVVTLPEHHPLRQRGDQEKCRYRWSLEG